jgi:hypothetical protein
VRANQFKRARSLPRGGGGSSADSFSEGWTYLVVRLVAVAGDCSVVGLKQLRGWRRRRRRTYRRWDTRGTDYGRWWRRHSRGLRGAREHSGGGGWSGAGVAVRTNCNRERSGDVDQLVGQGREAGGASWRRLAKCEGVQGGRM